MFHSTLSSMLLRFPIPSLKLSRHAYMHGHTPRAAAESFISAKIPKLLPGTSMLIHEFNYLVNLIINNRRWQDPQATLKPTGTKETE
jgi:hypothetical protein